MALAQGPPTRSAVPVNPSQESVEAVKRTIDGRHEDPHNYRANLDVHHEAGPGRVGGTVAAATVKPHPGRRAQ